MFSGKSEEYAPAPPGRDRAPGGRDLQAAIDDRFDAVDIVSHAGLADARHARSATPARSPRRRSRTTWVGIERGQFFGAELIGIVQSLTRTGRRVVCAGLDTDLRGLPFGPMPDLLGDRRSSRRQAPGGLPPVRHAGDDDAAAGGRQPAPFVGATISWSAPAEQSRPLSRLPPGRDPGATACRVRRAPQPYRA
jgi:hypothetical protein